MMISEQQPDFDLENGADSNNTNKITLNIQSGGEDQTENYTGAP